MSEKSLAEKRVLVVDDVPFNTRVLATALVDDYTVTFARGGVEALEMAGTEPQPDMILLDLLMADMDGFEVCARLKASAETAAIPVIFVTGLDDKINEERGFKIGGVDYIPKPINPAVVRARVELHLRLQDHRLFLARLEDGTITDLDQARAEARRLLRAPHAGDASEDPSA
jgi:putative two-component system response regulator